MKKKLKVVVLMSIIIVSMVSCTSTSQKIDNDIEITPAIENIFSRKSIRSYEDKDIEKEKIALLLQAAMSAPSGLD